jgi:hypothetical protein
METQRSRRWRSDEKGNLLPLTPDADLRLIALATNSIIERAWGKPRDYDQSQEPKPPAPFNPADFSHEEFFQIEAALRLIVERKAEKARALTAT